jgi:hypothetical protein
MASRAELIMAQVRGELGQIYRKKAPTTGEGILEDLTGAALGFNTATEAMYALEGSVKDFYAPDRVQKRTERRLNRRDRRALRKETRQLSYDEPFDDSGDSLYNPEGRPGTRPDTAPTYGPEPGVDTTPPMLLPSEDKVEKNLEAATGDLYLKGTIDTNFSNVGTFETTFADSTNVKFHNVDLDAINNQAGPPILNRDAFTAGQYAAGAPVDTIASDAKAIQNQNYLNYLLDTTTPPLPQPVRPEVGLPIQDEEERPLGNLFPQAIPGEMTVNQEPEVMAKDSRLDLLSDNYSSQYSLSQMEQLPESVRRDISSMPSGLFNLTDEQVKNNYNNFIVKDRINTLIEFGDTFGYGGGNQDINAIPKVQNALDVYTKKYMNKKGLGNK